MDKKNRSYELTIENASGESITITLPFTLKIDITRDTLSSQNICQLKVYNLSKVNRSFINHNVTHYGDYKLIRLKAGYGNSLGEIFSGSITQAWSTREGTDQITTIECFSAGFAFINGVTNKEYKKGTLLKFMLTDLAASLPKISLGTIGDYPGVLTRGASLSGNTAAILTEQSNGGFFVDQGKAHVLGTNEYIDQGNPIVINAESGLLGTPQLEQTKVVINLLFEPRLNVGHRIRLESITGLDFNGDYKIVGIKHQGVISSAVSGTLITTGTFFYSKLLTGVR